MAASRIACRTSASDSETLDACLVRSAFVLNRALLSMWKNENASGRACPRFELHRLVPSRPALTSAAASDGAPSVRPGPPSKRFGSDQAAHRSERFGSLLRVVLYPTRERAQFAGPPRRLSVSCESGRPAGESRCVCVNVLTTVDSFPEGERRHKSSIRGCILVDPASSHMLVSKIKPCMSKYKHLYCETANGSLNQFWFI